TPQEESIQILFPVEAKEHSHLADLSSEAEKEIISVKGGIFYPRVLEGIRELSRELPIFLVSNCESWYMDIFLELSKLRDHITDTQCYGEAQQPKAKMLENLQKKHGFKRGVYIGDTARDQEAAQKANFDFIFAAYGFGSSNGPCLSFDSSKKLMQHLIEDAAIDPH